MTQTGTRDVFYFVHVPKCAGRTVERYLQEILPDGQLLRPRRMAPPVHYVTGKSWRTPEVPDPSRVRAITGHSFGRASGDLLPPHRRIEAILLRDPVGLYLSWYNFRMNRHEGWGRKIPPFAFWYETRERNILARHVLTRHLGWSALRFILTPRQTILDTVIATLDTFWYVGSFKHADTLVAAVAEMYDAPANAKYYNKTDYRFQTREALPADFIKRIHAENDIDVALMARYAERGFDQGKALPPAPLQSRSAPVFQELKRGWYQILAHLKGL